jgi:hypothetical protein
LRPISSGSAAPADSLADHKLLLGQPLTPGIEGANVTFQDLRELHDLRLPAIPGWFPSIPDSVHLHPVKRSGSQWMAESEGEHEQFGSECDV